MYCSHSQERAERAASKPTASAVRDTAARATIAELTAVCRACHVVSNHDLADNAPRLFSHVRRVLSRSPLVWESLASAYLELLIDILLAPPYAAAAALGAHEFQ